ncbi:hypothetical protein SPRG_19256 [Saprolegnia parasitica CBS 223.65]|uniref:F-box/LRR-repeat protein 15-like leucin rich repeat domain-containing protein n=1 Tax=Saprolegnia parasitica (strain CBS 223.65) TaxID=695850 RepID=A0A067CWL3_SAPPC|nr:hypothetical protein SPRG_19256 [Saprolegnia parasitica CBS 223.65]KDO33635.1 hypothetical protein SPRG_19256 [Saprolegnia parasitica CBS 223.65]|eukprot:XP_012195675.1 hypothetical protein SPRG_19256 [Saprolegnia parasitica CBS 223.65]
MNSEPSPYMAAQRLRPTGRKRRLTLLPEAPLLQATKGYLIPLAHTATPVLVAVEGPETSPTKQPLLAPSPTRAKQLRKVKLKPARLPALSPPINNHSGDPATPPASARGLRDASALTIPIALFYTTEFLVELASTVHLSGWDAHDADLAYLTSPPPEKRNARLTHLYLSECGSLTDDGLRALGQLPALRVLHLSRCPQLSGMALLSVAATVVELDVSHSPWVVDVVFSCIVQSFSRLQSLLVAHCKPLTDQSMYALNERPHSHTPLTRLDLSGCVRLTDTGILAVLNYAPKLEELKLNALPHMDGVTLYGCLPQQRLVPLSLARLELAHVKNLHFASLLNVAKGCGKKLLHLDVTAALDAMTDDVLVALGRSCHHLETLILHGCARLTDMGLMHLVQYIPVEHEMDADFTSDRGTARCTRLRHLDLTGCYHVSAKGLVVLGANCPDLRSLVVSGLPRAIDSDAAIALARHCRHMREFTGVGMLIATDEQRLFGAPQLHARSLRALFLESTLTHINLNKANVKSDDLAPILRGIRFPRLTQLHLGSLVTDEVCSSLLKSASLLTHLNVSRSRHLSSNALCALLLTTPRLRFLDAQHCGHVENAICRVLIDACKELAVLNIAGNPYVTDAGVGLFEPDDVARCLTSLNVHGCGAHLPILQAVAATHPRTRVDPHHLALVPRPFETGAYLAQARRVQRAAVAIVRWTQTCLVRARQRLLRHQLARARLRHRSRMARRIQHAFRAQQARLATARRLVAEADALARTRERSARILQRALRSHVFYCAISRHVRLRREAAAYARYIAQVAKEQSAAQLLQRMYRGHLGRRAATRQRAANAERARRREAGARLVQRVWRGACGRAAASHLRASTTDAMTTYMLRMHCHLVASLHVTRIVRGFLGRKWTARWRRHVTEVAARRLAAARTIQKAFRAHFAGVAFARTLHGSSRTIQRHWRGVVGRRLATQCVLRDAYVRPVVLCLLAPRSIYQHALGERWQTKRMAALRVATALQKLLRGWYGRLRAHFVWSSWLERAYRQDVAARVLQRCFHHIVRRNQQARVRDMIVHRTTCAVQIQATWRMWKGKLRFLTFFFGRSRRRKHDATRALYWDGLCANDRHANAWSRFVLVQRGAVATLVRFYRSSLLARGWLSPSALRHRYQKASRIQAVVRGHLTRARVRLYAASVLIATQTLQRAWRRKQHFMRWRALTEASRERKRKRDEEDRAAGIAKARTNQFTAETIDRDTKAAILLQRTYRTLRQRAFYKKRMDARVGIWRAQAAAKIQASLNKQMAAVEFQADVWLAAKKRDVKFVEPALELNEDGEEYASIIARTDAMIQLDLEEQCDLLRETLANLTEDCYREFSTYELLAAEELEIQAHMRYFNDVKALNSRFRVETQALLEAQVPFATQGRQLILETSRLAGENQRLQHEVIRLNKIRTTFQSTSTDRLEYDPLLYELDIDHMLAALEPEWQPNSNVVLSAVTKQLERDALPTIQQVHQDDAA